MTLDEAVALSLLPDLSRVGLTARLRADDPVAARGRAPPARPGARARARSARQRRASTCSRGTIRGFPPRCSRCPTCRPALWYRGDARRAARARRRDRRLARRVRRRARDRAAARRRISPRAASPSSAASRAASIRRRTAARSRPAGRSPCSARASTASIRASTRRSPREIARDGPRGQRVSARHAAAAVSLPAAQPPDQRPVARRRRDRGVREVGLADHRRLRARTGARRDGGAGQRAERPQPGRTRADSGRRKDCGVCGRYRGGARLAAGPRPASGGSAVKCRSGQATSGDPLLRLMEAGQAYDLDALAAASGVDGVAAAAAPARARTARTRAARRRRPFHAADMNVLV